MWSLERSVFSVVENEKSRKLLEVYLKRDISIVEEYNFKALLDVWKYICLLVCVFSNERHQKQKSKPTWKQHYGFTGLPSYDHS